MAYGILDAAKDLILEGEIEKAEPAVIEKRRSICNSCDKRNKLGVCTECWCITEYKTEMAKASCPLNKW